MRYLFLVFLFTSGFALSQNVYKTPSGSKYHTATCKSVKNVSHKLSRQEARKKGLAACKICKPDSSIGQGSASARGLGIKSGEAQGTGSQAVQCRGTTQKGARCKRMTKNSNGYCFQHER